MRTNLTAVSNMYEKRERNVLALPLTKLSTGLSEQRALAQAANYRPRPGPKFVCRLCANSGRNHKLVRSELMRECIRVTKSVTDENSEDLKRKEPESLFKTASHALSRYAGVLLNDYRTRPNRNYKYSDGRTYM